MERILANATVEALDSKMWAVEVTGVAPFQHKRTYTLAGKTDNNAAQEGLRLFVEEMENLRDAASKG
jgi:hypothetical protein